MKQVLTTIRALLFSSPHHSTNRQKQFSKYRFVLLFSVITLIFSSCQKEDNHCKKTVSLKAEFQILVGQDDQITGTGKGTPIGKSTFVANDNAANFPLLTGSQIITAENGDQIFSTHSGSANGPDKNGILLITLNNVITGGTGRFADASGSFIAKGKTNTMTGTGTVSFDGTITLDECHGNKWEH